MESIKIGNATWLYDSEQDLAILELFYIEDKIKLNLNKIKNEEYMEAISALSFPNEYVSQKSKLIRQVRQLILLFKNQTDVLYKDVSKRIYISEQTTISNKCITYYYGHGM